MLSDSDEDQAVSQEFEAAEKQLQLLRKVLKKQNRAQQISEARATNGMLKQQLASS